ncbi:MAG: hypothetical protein M1815_002222 [Lichina confinis]|nr:MAG: hypothetical protein M1815_002222 [Lichina confinis]
MAVPQGSGIAIGKTVFLGTFIHCKSLNELDICEHGAIGVDEQGVIRFVDRSGQHLDALLQAHDTHIHASQYANVGLFGKTTLLDWLETYTFPMEASLRDSKRAKTVYSRCVRRTLSNGTTAAAYYATIDPKTTKLLADICLELGQRAFVGRCCMDRNSPDYYVDASAEKALEDTKATIRHIDAIDPDHELVCPIITPRFAVSCTRACLRQLGRLHQETDLPIQTHVSETTAECSLVKELFPECSSYTAVYDNHGLLTSRTILAHAIHLTDDERSLIVERDAKVAHCPTSNSALASGTARVRWLLDGGVTVGLGTDVSGGYSPSVLDAARQATLASHQIAVSEDGNDHAKLSVAEVLYLATRGGAAVLGLSGKIGGFDVGKRWDAQVVGLGKVTDDEGSGDDDSLETNPVDVFPWDDAQQQGDVRTRWERNVAKWVFNGDDRNTLAVWINGRLVHRRKDWQGT